MKQLIRNSGIRMKISSCNLLQFPIIMNREKYYMDRPKPDGREDIVAILRIEVIVSKTYTISVYSLSTASISSSLKGLEI